MPLYVLALTDTPVPPDVAGPLRLDSVELDGFYAICEQRRVAPPAEDDRLREQHALVREIASRARAVLPVRFGTLMRRRELVAFSKDHEQEIRAGLEAVRDRVQMTIRIVGRQPRPSSSRRATTGRGYLQQRRRVASPDLPPAVRSLLAALRPLVVRERQEPGVGRLLATVYHLVEASNSSRYGRKARQMATSAAVVTGPWPPFAFTPPLG